MVTDYSFSVENVLYSSEDGDSIGDSEVLTYWGGTIDGRTQGITSMRVPVVGERLIVMLRPDWSQMIGFTPVVGFNEGLFSVSEDEPGGAAIVHGATDQPLVSTSSRQVVRLKAV